MGKFPADGGIMARLMIVILFLSGFKGFAQDTLTVAFWNVENLFDLVDDPLTNDDEFALGGSKQVTQEILDLKLDHLAEGLADLDADVVGLSEVENRTVLEWLDRRYPGRDYAIVHFESPDHRGIDVALLYDARKFRVQAARPIPVPLSEGRTTRDILYVRGEFAGEVLHLFVNHWPSKYGGVEATIPFRAQAARTLRREVTAILEEDPRAEILIMGDLNDEPEEPSVRQHLGATLRPEEVGRNGFILVNLMAPFYHKPGRGTYVYQGANLVYDHIIVSRGLVDTLGLAVVEHSIRVNDKRKYRQQEGPYAGYPFRFWVGDQLLGGYSDHLGVAVQIVPRP
jgi:predicted extracellular nuclease